MLLGMDWMCTCVSFRKSVGILYNEKCQVIFFKSIRLYQFGDRFPVKSKRSKFNELHSPSLRCAGMDYTNLFSWHGHKLTRVKLNQINDILCQHNDNQHFQIVNHLKILTCHYHVIILTLWLFDYITVMRYNSLIQLTKQSLQLFSILISSLKDLT